MRKLYGILCCIAFVVGDIDIKARPTEENTSEELTIAIPNQKLLQSFKEMGLTESEISHHLKYEHPKTEEATDNSSSQHITNSEKNLQQNVGFSQVMQYMRECMGEAFLKDESFKTSLKSFKYHPREWLNLIMGASIGGTAAYSWSIVFGSDPNIEYFFYPYNSDRYVDTDSIAWPIFALVLFPEFLANVDVMGRLKKRSPLARVCESHHSKTHTVLTWSNRIITTIFLTQFFRIYYAATWSNPTLSGDVKTDNSVYWFAIAYMWSNWWKQYGILGHKIHLMSPKKSDIARNQTQSRLAEAYSRMQQGSDKQFLEFAAFVKQLDRNAITEDEKQQSMLAILSYLYDYSDQGEVDKKETEDPEDLIKDFRVFGPRPKPTSLKVAEWGGKIFATSVLPLAFFGAYFAWDSMLETVESRDEHWNTEDKKIKDTVSLVYGAIASVYSGVSGWAAGPVWGRHLWCRWNGKDPNQYREQLEYWPQNFNGLRAIMGGGTTYLLSSLLMFPIAGLTAEQLHVMGTVPMWAVKASLATTAQWGVILDTAFTGPRYQQLITKIGNLSGGDTIGTIKDDTLRMIVKLHEGIGNLKEDKLESLHNSLEELTKIREANMKLT